MNKRIVVNAIEVDAALPVKTQTVREAPQAFMQWLHSHEGSAYLAVASGGSEIAGLLRALGLEILETDTACGLACQEPSAVLQLLASEKPYPCIRSGAPASKQADTEVVNILELLPQRELLSLLRLPDGGGCALQQLLHLTDRLLAESCGKCVFCREGLGQMQSILHPIAEGAGEAKDLSTLQELTGLLREQVVCGFGPMAADAISNLMELHSEELTEHCRDGICRRAVCSGLSCYRILGSACTGCGDCLDVCDEDAIAGKPRFIHVISDRDCTRCGKCAEACTQSAIRRCSADKPICPPRPVPVGSWKK